ncbi:MAG: restriction endonuclease subunit S [Limisphaerales bacterium]
MRFGDVVKQLKEQVDPVADGVERYVAGEHMETENVHIRQWGNVGDGYLGPAFIRGFRKGQVLYGSRRTYLKKVAVAEWDGVTANTTYVLEADETKLLQRLLPWLMLSEKFTRHSVQESKGSTNPYINFPDIAKFEFDLPPLDQQRRIAEILWAVDESLQQATALAKSVENAKFATVEEHFNRSLANKLNVQPLEAVAKVSYGITLGGYRKTLPIARPYLRVANVQRNAFDLSEVKTIKCAENEIDRFELADGDVLIVEGHASVTEIGRAAVWRSTERGTLHQNHLIRVRCSDSLIPEYLNLCVNGGVGQEYFRSRSKSSSGLNTINSTVVKEFPVPIAPVRVQETLIAEIAEFDGSLRSVEVNEGSLRNLVRTILNTIFA